MNEIENLVKILDKKQLTIATMESCTGGYLANLITNISGASDVFKFGAVTYHTDYKTKLGVSKDTIKKHSVYSIETAKEMAKAISEYANSSYGIGITGKLNNKIEPDEVDFAIYIKEKNEFITKHLSLKKAKREINKIKVSNEIIDILLKIV